MVAVAETSLAVAQPRRPRGPMLHFIGRLFREKPLGAFGAVICVLFLFCGIFADVLAPYGYNQISPINRLKPPSLEVLVRHRQSRPRHALALPLRRAALGDHRLLRRRHRHRHLDLASASSRAISAASSTWSCSASSMPG